MYPLSENQKSHNLSQFYHDKLSTNHRDLKVSLFTLILYDDKVFILFVYSWRQRSHIMEDKNAIKPAYWQTSLFRLQNVKPMMTTINI